MCGSSPKTPDVPAATPPPAPVGNAEAEAQVREAKKREQAAMAKKQGRASTILTGPTGLLEEANVQKKTVLGQ